MQTRFAVASILSVISLVSVAGLAACSASGGDGASGPPGDILDTQPRPGDGGAARNDGRDDDPDGDPKKDCEPNPSCARHLCRCKDDRVMATDGVCLAGGSCDTIERCEAACGGPDTFSGFSWEEKACSQEGAQCFAAQPNVSCECNVGFGIETYGRCTKGYCSTAPMNVCPSACASEGGWSCKGAEDCTPVVCGCKDGQFPVTAGSCAGTSCAPSSAVCPAACTDHGGWAGDGSSTKPDGGTKGPKAPGEACTTGSECTPFDCGCNDGTTFDQLKACQSKKCATKAQTCSSACLSSGGWDGL